MRSFRISIRASTSSIEVTPKLVHVFQQFFKAVELFVVIVKLI